MSHMDELRQVIADVLDRTPIDSEAQADVILDATYPPACQTCRGTGERVQAFDDGYIKRSACPDCPTIAQLLAWGVAVATLKRCEGNKVAHPEADEVWPDRRYTFAGTLLDAIRAVKP